MDITYQYGFFAEFGSAVQTDNNYNLLTENGSKNLTHTNTEMMIARAYQLSTYFKSVFSKIIQDRGAGRLSNDKYHKFMRYYHLLLCDTTLIAKYLKEDSQLVDGVKSFGGKKNIEAI